MSERRMRRELGLWRLLAYTVAVIFLHRAFTNWRESVAMLREVQKELELMAQHLRLGTLMAGRDTPETR